MVGTLVKEGEHYAYYDKPRKGVTDLYQLDAQRVRVIIKGVERYAKNSNEGIGDYVKDGVRVQDDAMSVFTIKARDILMPWEQYSTERQRREDEEARRAQEQASRSQAWLRQRDGLAQRLREDFGLQQGNRANDSAQRGFVLYYQDGHPGDIAFGVSNEGMEKLLDSVASMVYAILAESE